MSHSHVHELFRLGMRVNAKISEVRHLWSEKSHSN